MPFFGGGGASSLDASLYLQKAGGTMLGPLVLAADPIMDLQASTKQYVDANSIQHVAIELVMPNEFVVTGSPAAYDGTFTVEFADQAANMVFAGPASGADDAPSFRLLVSADISDLSTTLDDYLPLTGGSLTGSLDITGDLSATGKLEAPTIDSGSSTPVQFVPDLEADQIVLNPDIQSWGTVQAALAAIDTSIITLARGMAYVGSYDAANDVATFVSALSSLDGPLPLANAAGLHQGDFLIATSDAAGPPAIQMGDQLISGGPMGGTAWDILNVGHVAVTASMVALSPQVSTWTTAQEAIQGIDDTAFLDRDIAVAPGTDLNTLTRPGGYLWNALDQATYVNGPSMRSTSYGTLSVIKSNMYVLQRLVVRTTDTVNGIWERWMNPSMNAYDPWRRAADERNVTVEEIVNQNATQPAWVKVAAVTIPTAVNANRQLRIKVSNRSAGGFNISTWFLTLRISTSGTTDPLTQYTASFSIRKMDLSSTQALEFGYVRNYTNGTLDIYAKTTTTLVALVVSKYDIADASFTTILPDGITWATTEPADGANPYTVIPVQNTFLHDGSTGISLAQNSVNGSTGTQYIKIASYAAPTAISSAAIKIDLKVDSRMNSSTAATAFFVSFTLVRSAMPYTVSAGVRRFDLNSTATLEFGYVRNDTAGTFDVYAKSTLNYPIITVSKWTLNSDSAGVSLLPDGTAWSATVPSDGANAYTVIDQPSVALLSSAGYLGIGTTAQTPLDVRSTPGAAGDMVCSLARLIGDNNFVLRTANGGPNVTNAEACRIGLYYHTGNIWNAGIRFFRGSGTSDGFMALDTSGVERMRITGVGLVGIGNDAMTVPFSNAANFPQVIVGTTAAGSSYGFVTVCGNTPTITDSPVGVVAWANYAITATEKRIAEIHALTGGAINSGVLRFDTWNAGTRGERMRITSAGYVGIGTDAAVLPQSSTPLRFLIVGSSTSATNYGVAALVGNVANVDAAVGDLSFANYNITATEKRLVVLTGRTSGAVDSGALAIHTMNAGGTVTERMRITPIGNVGIANSGVNPIAPAGYPHLVVGPSTSSAFYGFVTACGNTTTLSNAPVGVFAFANFAVTGAEKRIAEIHARTDGAVNSGFMAFYTWRLGANTERMRIDSMGNVGLSVVPSYLLHLASDSAAKPGTNTWTITSDIRTKRNVEPFEGGIETIRLLEPIVAEYNGKARMPDGQRVVSLDPAKLREIVPHAVTSVRGKLNESDGEETDILGVNTHELFYHMLRAVQQLDKRLQELEK